MPSLDDLEESKQDLGASKAKDRECIVEVHHRKLTFQVVPLMEYHPRPQSSIFSVYVSQKMRLSELHLRIAQTMVSKDKKSISATEMVKSSRIWKLDQECNTAADLKKAVYQTNADPNKLPIEAHGEVLNEKTLVGEVNAAENEVLMYEIKISLDSKSY